MGRYIVVPIARDPVDASDAFTEVVRRQYPDWEAAEPDAMTVFRDAVSVLYADTAELATRAGEELFRYFGRGLAGIPPTEERPAYGQVLVTAIDTDGPYEVPEGLELEAPGPLGEPRGFRTLAAGVIPNGQLTTIVDIEATDEGVESNGMTGPVEFSEFVDYLAAVEFVGTTGGGEDRETDPAFLDRLQDELAISTPRPVLPWHFEVLARRLGAFRATAINGLDPVAGTTGNRAMVALAMIDEAGNDLPSADETAIIEAIRAMREVGWEVPLLHATRTVIDAAFTGTAYPDWDPVAVHDAAVAALTDYLSPATWGIREDTGEEREWLNEPLVRWGEAYERLQRVEGMRYVDTLALGANGGALGGIGVNVTMVGYAPLPTPGNIAGVVSPG